MCQEGEVEICAARREEEVWEWEEKVREGVPVWGGGEGWEENVKTKEGKKKNMVGVSEPRGVG